MECDFEDPEARWHHQQEKGFFFNLKNLLLLLLLQLLRLLFVCMDAGMCVTTYTWRSGGSFVKSVLSFYLYMGSRYQTQTISLMQQVFLQQRC